MWWTPVTGPVSGLLSRTKSAKTKGFQAGLTALGTTNNCLPKAGSETEESLSLPQPRLYLRAVAMVLLPQHREAMVTQLY